MLCAQLKTILIIFLAVNTELCRVATAAGPSKIKVDSSTRLYIEEQTGRYRMFHGLALENSGSPWYYATYSTEQIKLLKQVTSNVLYSSIVIFSPSKQNKMP